MKFFSKNANYRVVLEPGSPPDPRTGRGGERGLSVLFKDGVAEVEDQEHIEKMLNHSDYGTDFVTAEEQTANINQNTHSHSEPKHELQEIKFGHVTDVDSDDSGQGISQKMQEFIKKEAVKLAKGMAKDMAKKQIKKVMQEGEGSLEEDGEMEESQDNVQQEDQEDDTIGKKAMKEQSGVGGIERTSSEGEDTSDSDSVEQEELTTSDLMSKTKPEMEEFAEEEYGIELDTNNLKKQMVENFFEELNS